MNLLSDKGATQECVWELLKAKIELEHEVLLREMDACLIALAGFPITVITLVLQFELWENPTIMTWAALIFAIGVIGLDSLRSYVKEKLIAKQKEIDKLMLEMMTSLS